MQVDHRVQRLEVVLHLHPLPEGANVVAQVGVPVGWTPERMRGTGLFLAARGCQVTGCTLPWLAMTATL